MRRSIELRIARLEAALAANTIEGPPGFPIVIARLGEDPEAAIRRVLGSDYVHRANQLVFVVRPVEAKQSMSD